ncbi:unnamed protein product [Colias eurytheme]|nr:unnamed protein product [Colias eurytheme]
MKCKSQISEINPLIKNNEASNFRKEVNISQLMEAPVNNHAINRDVCTARETKNTPQMQQESGKMNTLVKPKLSVGNKVNCKLARRPINYDSAPEQRKYKAVLYKDICITGEKISIWKKIKSGLLSSISDFNVKSNPVLTQIPSKRTTTSIEKVKDLTSCKPQYGPFSQTYWNMHFNCKHSPKENCDECLKNKKPFKPICKNKKDECFKLPLLQFPDVSQSYLYKTMSPATQSKSNDKIFHKLHCSTSCKDNKNSKGFKVNVTKSKKAIIIKSKQSLCQTENTRKYVKEKYTQLSATTPTLAIDKKDPAIDVNMQK